MAEPRGPDRAPLEAAISLSIAMALSGTAGVFSIQSGQPTLNVVFFRCLFGALSLFAWCALRGKVRGFWSIDRALLPLALISGLFLVLNWAALFEAFRLTSIGLATIIYHLQPFWIVLAGTVLLGETLSRDKLAWIVVAFVGLVLVVGPKAGVIHADQNWLIGIGFALLASLLYAGSTLTARALGAFQPEAMTILHCCLGALIFAPFLTIGTLGKDRWQCGAGSPGWARSIRALSMFFSTPPIRS